MVPVVDLTRRAARFQPEYLRAVERVLSSGWWLLGPELAALEADLATWSGQAHAVGVASGASAIQLALAGLGVGPGDEVLVPAFTAAPTASAVWATGAAPVFVDVDRETAEVPAGGWDAARTARTKAIVTVHLYGRPADPPVSDLAIVEDAAQAHGAVEPRTASAAVAYSFYPTKNLGGVGDGGAVLTDDPELAERIRRLRVHGMRAQYEHVERSQNFRLSELEAAWLRLTLPALAQDNERRRAIAARYRGVGLCWQADHPRHVHHLAVFRVAARDAVRATLQARGVETAVHYPLALPHQPAYRDYARQPCPEAAAWAASCVTVPCFPELDDQEVDQVVHALAGMVDDGLAHA